MLKKGHECKLKPKKRLLPRRRASNWPSKRRRRAKGRPDYNLKSREKAAEAK